MKFYLLAFFVIIAADVARSQGVRRERPPDLPKTSTKKGQRPSGRPIRLRRPPPPPRPPGERNNFDFNFYHRRKDPIIPVEFHPPILRRPTKDGSVREIPRSRSANRRPRRRRTTTTEATPPTTYYDLTTFPETTTTPSTAPPTIPTVKTTTTIKPIQTSPKAPPTPKTTKQPVKPIKDASNKNNIVKTVSNATTNQNNLGSQQSYGVAGVNTADTGNVVVSKQNVNNQPKPQMYAQTFFGNNKIPRPPPLPPSAFGTMTNKADQGRNKPDTPMNRGPQIDQQRTMSRSISYETNSVAQSRQIFDTQVRSGGSFRRPSDIPAALRPKVLSRLNPAAVTDPLPSNPEKYTFDGKPLLTNNIGNQQLKITLSNQEANVVHDVQATAAQTNQDKSASTGQYTVGGQSNVNMNMPAIDLRNTQITKPAARPQPPSSNTASASAKNVYQDVASQNQNKRANKFPSELNLQTVSLTDSKPQSDALHNPSANMNSFNRVASIPTRQFKVPSANKFPGEVSAETLSSIGAPPTNAKASPAISGNNINQGIPIHNRQLDQVPSDNKYPGEVISQRASSVSQGLSSSTGQSDIRQWNNRQGSIQNSNTRPLVPDVESTISLGRSPDQRLPDVQTVRNPQTIVSKDKSIRVTSVTSGFGSDILAPKSTGSAATDRQASNVNIPRSSTQTGGAGPQYQDKGVEKTSFSDTKNNVAYEKAYEPPAPKFNTINMKSGVIPSIRQNFNGNSGSAGSTSSRQTNNQDPSQTQQRVQQRLVTPVQSDNLGPYQPKGFDIQSSRKLGLLGPRPQFDNKGVSSRSRTMGVSVSARLRVNQQNMPTKSLEPKRFDNNQNSPISDTGPPVGTPYNPSSKSSSYSVGQDRTNGQSSLGMGSRSGKSSNAKQNQKNTNTGEYAPVGESSFIENPPYLSGSDRRNTVRKTAVDQLKQKPGLEQIPSWAPASPGRREQVPSIVDTRSNLYAGNTQMKQQQQFNEIPTPVPNRNTYPSSNVESASGKSGHQQNGVEQSPDVGMGSTGEQRTRQRINAQTQTSGESLNKQQARNNESPIVGQPNGASAQRSQNTNMDNQNSKIPSSNQYGGGENKGKHVSDNKFGPNSNNYVEGLPSRKKVSVNTGDSNMVSNSNNQESNVVNDRMKSNTGKVKPVNNDILPKTSSALDALSNDRTLSKSERVRQAGHLMLEAFKDFLSKMNRGKIAPRSNVNKQHSSKQDVAPSNSSPKEQARNNNTQKRNPSRVNGEGIPSSGQTAKLSSGISEQNRSGSKSTNTIEKESVQTERSMPNMGSPTRSSNVEGQQVQPTKIAQSHGIHVGSSPKNTATDTVKNPKNFRSDTTPSIKGNDRIVSEVSKNSALVNRKSTQGKGSKVNLEGGIPNQSPKGADTRASVKQFSKSNSVERSRSQPGRSKQNVGTVIESDVVSGPPPASFRRSRNNPSRQNNGRAGGAAGVNKAKTGNGDSNGNANGGTSKAGARKGPNTNKGTRFQSKVVSGPPPPSFRKGKPGSRSGKQGGNPNKSNNGKRGGSKKGSQNNAGSDPPGYNVPASAHPPVLTRPVNTGTGQGGSSAAKTSAELTSKRRGGKPGQEPCSLTPVCGSDGFTYMSSCFLWDGLTVSCDGYCPCPTGQPVLKQTSQSGVIREPVPSPLCNCPAKYSPVCSTTGTTFENDCARACNGEAIACDGECPCPVKKKPKPCEAYCDATYNPVCSVWGRSYDNECLRHCSGEAKDCDGECPCPYIPNSAVGTADGSGGASYDPRGAAYDPNNVNNEPSNQPLSTCECRPGDIDPVCTTNGETLWYGCEAICLGVTIACSSECPC